MSQDPIEHDNRQIDEILSDPQANAQLRLELAATVDAGKPMVESTYILEGDGTLAWKCSCLPACLSKQWGVYKTMTTTATETRTS